MDAEGLENMSIFKNGLFRAFNKTVNNINLLKCRDYNNYTGYTQKLWKSFKPPLITKVFLFILLTTLLFSCNPFKSTKKAHPALDSAIINMSENEIRKRLGTPDIVSRTPENRILWTYRPSWKVMPDNKDTVYVEFEEGKVVKVLKAR